MVGMLVGLGVVCASYIDKSRLQVTEDEMPLESYTCFVLSVLSSVYCSGYVM